MLGVVAAVESVAHGQKGPPSRVTAGSDQGWPNVVDVEGVDRFGLAAVVPLPLGFDEEFEGVVRLYGHTPLLIRAICSFAQTPGTLAVQPCGRPINRSQNLGLLMPPRAPRITRGGSLAGQNLPAADSWPELPPPLRR